MEYQISPLPSPCSALEPHIDAETMLIHHGHYYGSYARDLNRILSLHPELRGNSVQELVIHLAGVPESIRDAVRYYAGGCLNHEIYFSLLRPPKNYAPAGALGEAIRANFRDFERFQRKFEEAALSLFGSGWVWLVCSGVHRGGLGNSAPRLRILTTQDHGNPLSLGLFPILGADLWEHAYHHRYRNDRQAYLAAWWQVVDWQAVEERYVLAEKALPRKQQPLLTPLREAFLDLPAFRSIA
jgi:Fe-Mn family superoxide dismutase